MILIATDFTTCTFELCGITCNLNFLVYYVLFIISFDLTLVITLSEALATFFLNYISFSQLLQIVQHFSVDSWFEPKLPARFLL